MRHDLTKTRAIISAVQRDVNEIQYILKTREDSGSQNWAVSDTQSFMSPNKQ